MNWQVFLGLEDIGGMSQVIPNSVQCLAKTCARSARMRALVRTVSFGHCTHLVPFLDFELFTLLFVDLFNQHSNIIHRDSRDTKTHKSLLNSSSCASSASFRLLYSSTGMVSVTVHLPGTKDPLHLIGSLAAA